MPATSLAFDDANEVRDLGDHAAHRRRVLKRRAPPDAVETEPDERLALLMRAANRAAGLLDDDCLACHDCASRSAYSRFGFSAADLAARLQRRDLEIAAGGDGRGESSRLSASNVARTML